jgi:hypothetical protein
MEQCAKQMVNMMLTMMVKGGITQESRPGV